MAASIAVEVETGTCTDVRVRHNGYFAGDFARTRTQINVSNRPTRHYPVESALRPERG